VAAVKKSYEHGVTDEFIEPVTIVDERNEPVGLIRDEDACIFFNYRADRGREMTMALTDDRLEQPPALDGAEESALHHHDAVR
jgi:2,3-bisphosphoglycerate-independent phosphoglycerate mutase